MNLHRPVLDESEGVATFYLYNLSGQLVGYHQYRPTADKTRHNHPKDGRYFTYRKQPTITLWGVESLYLTPKLLFLTEGVFDAARITERGFSAVAVLSNDPARELKNWLACLNRKVIAVCDNDEAGKKLAKFGTVAAFTEEKDLGDSSDEFVTNFIARYTC